MYQGKPNTQNKEEQNIESHRTQLHNTMGNGRITDLLPKMKIF